VKGRQLILRVDHMNGCIHFGDIVFEADTMRKQLTDLATGLKDVVKQISPETKLKNMEAEKRQKTHYFQSVASRLGNDNTQILNRKQIIEKKKEDLERLQHEKAMEEQKKLQQNEAERKKSEEERLKKAASDRKTAMMERVKKQVEVQEQLEALKKKYGNQSAIGDIEKMDVDQRQKLLKEAQKKEKEKKEEKLRKIKEASKRLDFITRAIREKERPILDARNEEQSKKESAIFDKNWELKLDEMKNAHGDKVDLKKKVEHIRGCDTQFKDAIIKTQKSSYDQMCEGQYAEAEVDRLSAKLERARARYMKAQQEEQQRVAAEEEEKRRVEKQKRDEEDQIRSRELQEEARRKRDEFETERSSQQTEQQNRGEEWSSDWRGDKVQQAYDATPHRAESGADSDNRWGRAAPAPARSERPEGSRWGGAAGNFRNGQEGTEPVTSESGGARSRSAARPAEQTSSEGTNRWGRQQPSTERGEETRAPLPPREADTVSNWRSAPREKPASRPEDSRPPRTEPDWNQRAPRDARYPARENTDTGGSWKRSERPEGSSVQRAPQRDSGDEPSWKREPQRRDEGPRPGSSWRSSRGEDRAPPRNSDRGSEGSWGRGSAPRDERSGAPRDERSGGSRWGDRNAGGDNDRPRDTEGGGGWRRGGADSGGKGSSTSNSGGKGDRAPSRWSRS